jgi:hypothetical protein
MTFCRGLTYSFQYMDANGDTLLRYDNAPYHLDVGRHHRHPSAGDITTLGFAGLSDLTGDFQNLIKEIYERGPD